MVDPSLPPTGPPIHVSAAAAQTAAGGRELLTLDEITSVIDPALWNGLRRVARIFTEMQQSRKRLLNQIAETKTDGTPRKDAASRRPFHGYDRILAAAENSEKTAKDLLLARWREAVGKDLPLARLAKDTPGLAWFSIARLLGETGHPLVANPYHWEQTAGPDKRVLVADDPYVRSQRQWLAYCGFGDPDRQRRAGMSQEELFACGSTPAKTAAWLIATTGLRSATGKADKNGQMRRAWPWRELYDSTKERTRVTHPEWAPWRHQKSAERVMTKAVLIEIYRTAWADVEARLAAR